MAKTRVDLYDSHYDRLDHEVYRSIRAETYDVDLGQESWITAAECDRFCDWLRIEPGHRVLEVACGSGGIAARIAATRGASVVGTDVNPLAIRAAKTRPLAGAAGRVEFLEADADKALSFPDGSFDAVFCNDAILHFRDRPLVLAEWRRVLRDGGRCLFTDPVVITGFVSNEELEARSSIGFFLFSVPGANEALMEAAGLRVEQATDATQGVAQSSRRWREARERQRAALLRLETEAGYEGLQRFLAAVHSLATRGRLSRVVYVGKR